MTPRDAAFYDAYLSRDPRFDGVFFIGVISTGIYCRPVCPARAAKPANCRFFDSAAAAEKETFRPCLRCRPELAPGSAPVDDASRIAHLIMSRIEDGLAADDAAVEEIAAQFDLSSRQLRRIVRKELGVTPIQIKQTRRLLLAKQLLTETTLSVIDIAFASGFTSLRRFNDSFRKHYRMPPSRFRRTVAGRREGDAPGEASTVLLGYRPPYDYDGILDFLGLRGLKGVESITPGRYCRTVELGRHRGWIKVRNAPGRHSLLLEFSHELTPALPSLLARMRSLFDLKARPDLIAERLTEDATLRPMVKAKPGTRVPGAFDGFELAVRAILGQQVSVKGATTLASRFVGTFGEPFDTPFTALSRLSPRPERVVLATVDEIASLGITRTRARSILLLAEAVLSGDLRLHPGIKAETSIERLLAVPGIGPWTAHYIVMRALNWPDALPSQDAVLRKNLGGVTAERLEERAQDWRPWRSYAVIHIWRQAQAGYIGGSACKS